MKQVVILGSTGSIGGSTLEVIALNPDKFQVVGLSAHKSIVKLAEQCARFKPLYAALSDEAAARQLSQILQKKGLSTEVLAGEQGLCQVAACQQADFVIAAIVGAVGLMPTLSAVRAGKRVILANKEALVMAGSLFIKEVATHKATLLPIDSEHNAIFQCLPEANQSGRARGSLKGQGIDKIILTGSGGPFLRTELDQLASMTPDQACAHPNWTMGRKISVDSATMMNKGLEMIEACWLFDAKPSDIKIVIHPQSIVHSMVSYVDGSVLAQLGKPDMKTPIAHALAWPERIASGVAALDLLTTPDLHFEAMNFQRFPCVQLAYQAMLAGGTASCVLNAANEIAVAAFLQQRIRFNQIAQINESLLNKHEIVTADSIATVIAADQKARQLAAKLVNELSN